tara:strand:- start:126 stop:305 length:180 start_codon:yes stop_codon:yes gene_type:complete
MEKKNLSLPDGDTRLSNSEHHKALIEAISGIYSHIDREVNLSNLKGYWVSSKAKESKGN